MNTLVNIFERNGSVVKAGGNNPILLDAADTVWMIKCGEIDIFSLRMSRDKLMGRRNHVLRMQTGQLVFSIQRLHESCDIVMLAVGRPGTELVACKQSIIQEAIRDDSCRKDFVSLADQWIGGLSETIAQGESAPRKTEYLEHGNEISVVSGAAYRPENQSLWIRFHAGRLLFLGCDDVQLPTQALFPVSPKAWIHSIEGGGGMSVSGTLDVTSSGEVWEGLSEFHRVVLKYILISTEYQDEVEHKRMANKKRIDAQAMQTALHRMSAVLEPRETRVSSEQPNEDPLVLACRMICRTLDIQMNTPDPERQKYGGSVSLKAIARASRFRTRRVVLRGSWWKKDNGPLLAFRESDKRPLALLPVSGNRYFFHDPVTHLRVRVTRKNAAEFEPVAHMIYRPFPQSKLSGRDLFRFGVVGCGRDIAVVSVLGFVGAALGVLVPLLAGYIYDSVVPEALHSLLIQIIFMLATSAIGILLIQIARAIAVVRIEGRMTHGLQTALWDRLISLPVTFFGRYSAGDLTKRGLGIFAINAALSNVAVDAILSFIFSLVYLGLFMFYAPKLAFIAVGITFLVLLVIGFLVFRQIRYQREISAIEGNNAGLVLQLLSGIANLKNFGAENRAFEVWSRLFARKKGLAYRYGRIGNMVETINAAFPVIILVAIFSWILAKNPATTSVGTFIAFVTAFTVFQTALLQLVSTIAQTSNIIAYYERIKPIIETLPETDETKTRPGELSGDIEISHVNFRYKEDGPLILKDLSLRVKSGEFVALVGESGSGKSTLLRLLLGFETPESGTIYYDGHDMASLDIRELRNQMGVVLQTGKLMPGDIFKNIVGASSLTVDDAWEAARMVGLEEDIKAMPMGMYTFVGAQGGCFSGGQRQRILIARAIVNRPRILFFDEATSAMDNLTQAMLGRNIEELRATRVVIAHRLSTVLHADRIHVMQKGKLVESGTYEQLMDKKGVFFEIAARQLAGDSHRIA